MSLPDEIIEAFEGTDQHIFSIYDFLSILKKLVLQNSRMLIQRNKLLIKPFN